MKIEVLGSGCRKCNATAEAIRQTAAELGSPAEVDKVTDPRALLRHGVMSTPAVVVDGALVHSGSVPDREKITGWLSPDASGGR